MKKTLKILFTICLLIIIILSILITVRYSMPSMGDKGESISSLSGDEKPQLPFNPKSPSYKMVGEILQKLGISNIKIVPGSISWNVGENNSKYYNGYGFEKYYTPAEKNKIDQTWRTTNKVDVIDVSTRFENELKDREFLVDWSNSGDATFKSAIGYTTKDFVCLIKRNTIEIPPEQLSDIGGNPTSVTVICADKK